MTDPNADCIAYWNGPAADRWASEQPALDRAFARFADRLFEAAALVAGERVLDVGCGCGTTALAAAAVVGATGSVIGVDVSAPMLDRAAARSSGRANLSYVRADAATLRFDAPFDAMISRFGVMFFRHPAAAFANLRAALREGGRVAFLCWRAAQDNEWARVPLDAAARFLPAEPPSAAGEPGPFSFADRARVQHVLVEAGFSAVRVEPFDAEVTFSEEGLAGAVDFATKIGPAARRLRDAPAALRDDVRAELERCLASHARGQRVALGGAAWVVSARV